MAYIKFTSSDKIEFLHTEHVFGRKNPAANTSLNCDLVSRNHAAIEWNGSTWTIQDLSRNGTWLNGKQLDPHVATQIDTNDFIKLGNDDSSGVSFKVCNVDKPQSIVYRPHPELQIVPILESCLIPDPMSPDFGLYYCQDRKGWFSQNFNSDSSSSNELENGPHSHADEIIYAGNRWSLFLLDFNPPSTPASKPAKNSISDIEFQIQFNRANDNIRIQLISEQTELTLEPRPYTSIVAQLINLQQESNDGWVSLKKLCKATGKDKTNINFQLFMLRHHLSLSLVHHKGISKVIERNDSSLRLGLSNFSIYRDGKLDHSSYYHP